MLVRSTLGRKLSRGPKMDRYDEQRKNLRKILLAAGCGDESQTVEVELMRIALRRVTLLGTLTDQKAEKIKLKRISADLIKIIQRMKNLRPQKTCP
jgi:hypothetical protein